MPVQILILLAAIVPYCLADPPFFYPCSLDNYQCIGSYLQSPNNYCDPAVRGYIKQEFQVAELGFETPYFNASYKDTNLIIRNLNLCSVSEFYINTVTNKIVMGIDCPQKDDEADRILYQHRSLREDDIFNFHIRAVYPLIRMTVIFTNQRFGLCQANVLAEVLGLPDLVISPLDRPTADFLAKDLTLLNVYETENFFFRGPPIARAFVQAMLCDYGCDIAPGIRSLP